ncbi:hypothetical protein [Streptomyces griseochromogenes]|uniref:hypothetical protein n=1 Tax=Streptomyces griseochromogenes TaxID=68214 RepID=UPI0037A702EF
MHLVKARGPARTPVAATGPGRVTPAGIGRDAAWAGLCAGQSTATAERGGDGLPVAFSCRAPGLGAADLVGHRLGRRHGRFTSRALPTLPDGAPTGSWQGAPIAFCRAGPVRICRVRHVTRSVNSICRAAGSRPFRGRDHFGDVWGPAPVSLGDSWHDLHRVGPAGARHDVRRPDRRRITARRGEAPEGERHEDGGPQE